MSIFASILRSVYKLSGAKKAFALPEDALRKEIEKQNRHRGVFTPTDHKAYYETSQCLDFYREGHRVGTGINECHVGTVNDRIV